jgi:galactokinase/mevalonate kinase-like predicted kinase
MADLVKHDVQAFTKELDPNLGWEKQKEVSKRRLKERIDAKYEFGRDCDILGEKYL